MSQNFLKGKPNLFLSLFLGSLIFTSCASASYDKSLNTSQSVASSEAVEKVADFDRERAQVPQNKPQLIKKAQMSVVVKSLDKSVDTVEQIINQQQGYLQSLEQQQLDYSDSKSSARVILRVPQGVLEIILDQLAELGTVQGRSVSTEDVGEKIVDFEARLTNLRRTESNLQKIMDKSGSIKDILSVEKELTQVREKIERITAQLKTIKNKVAYSTINLNLSAAVTSTNNQPELPSQIQDAWNNSTNSFVALTVGLMKLGIWLIVYTPYLLILVAAGYFLKRKFRFLRRSQQIPQSRNSENN
ncbi:MAG: DUF4349 domain-containing protein [Rivularia sp. ALOHA_DT_140]|nr:DUF4349 domain-containing protein [Rivularia sp. ALOHA_DT_140]